MSGFVLDGEEYHLEYEGLHLLCSSCGVYGHRHEVCPMKKTGSQVECNGESMEPNVQKKVDGGNDIGEQVITQETWTVV